MANKIFRIGMLVMVLVFAVTVVGCEQPLNDESPYNKFYGVWVQALPVADVSFIVKCHLS